jgi:hypothetical protein
MTKLNDRKSTGTKAGALCYSAAITHGGNQSPCHPGSTNLPNAAAGIKINKTIPAGTLQTFIMGFQQCIPNASCKPLMCSITQCSVPAEMVQQHKLQKCMLLHKIVHAQTWLDQHAEASTITAEENMLGSKYISSTLELHFTGFSIPGNCMAVYFAAVGHTRRCFCVCVCQSLLHPTHAGRGVLLMHMYIVT